MMQRICLRRSSVLCEQIVVLLRIDRVRRVEKAEARRVLMETGGHIVPSARRMIALQNLAPRTAIQVRLTVCKRCRYRSRRLWFIEGCYVAKSDEALLNLPNPAAQGENFCR